MKIIRLKILALISFTFLQTKAQESKGYFNYADSILMIVNMSQQLYNKLDTAKTQFIPSRSNLEIIFDRELDFGYKHQRINLKLNLKNFQIDLLKRNDTIYAKTIRHYYNPFEIDSTTLAFNSSIDTMRVLDYLNQRNKLYNSNKSLYDLTKEISKSEIFAFYCGDGSPETDEGINITKLVDNKNAYELYLKIQSICIETQAYGVAGFDIMARRELSIPTDIKRLIKHIKKRNSETLICSGCIIGIIKKIYSKRTK